MSLTICSAVRHILLSCTHLLRCLKDVINWDSTQCNVRVNKCVKTRLNIKKNTRLLLFFVVASVVVVVIIFMFWLLLLYCEGTSRCQCEMIFFLLYFFIFIYLIIILLLLLLCNRIYSVCNGLIYMYVCTYTQKSMTTVSSLLKSFFVRLKK